MNITIRSIPIEGIAMHIIFALTIIILFIIDNKNEQ